MIGWPMSGFSDMGDFDTDPIRFPFPVHHRKARAAPHRD
jgi:hypothetical protein